MMTVLEKDLLHEAEEILGPIQLAQLLATKGLSFDDQSADSEDTFSNQIADLILGVSRCETPNFADVQRRMGRRTLRSLSSSNPQDFGKEVPADMLLESIGIDVYAAMSRALRQTPKAEVITRPLHGGAVEITFRSPMPLQNYCRGMIEACLETMQEKAFVLMHDMEPPFGAHVCFEIYPGAPS